MRHSLNRSAWIAAAALMAVSCSVGCVGPTTGTDSSMSSLLKTPSWMKQAPWSSKKGEKPEPYPGAAKMAVTWTPDVLVQTGKTPTRGFGGRLFFFNEKSKSVPVEGTLTVHGFEGDARQGDQQIRPFKFTPEQFTKHFSNSDFGASYSIWIPWDAVGGEQKRISLVATFETKEGRYIQSPPTTVILPGTNPELDSQLSTTTLSQQYQTHRDAITKHPTRPSGLVTTTIRRHTTGADGTTKTRVEGSFVGNRRTTLAAANRHTVQDGATPFIDVPLVPSQPKVMAASAEMSNETTPRRMTIHATSQR